MMDSKGGSSRHPQTGAADLSLSVNTIVGIENAETIYKAAKLPKSFVSLGDADHLVSRPKDAQFLGHVLSVWVRYYVVPPAT